MLARLFAPRRVDIESDNVVVTAASVNFVTPSANNVTINGVPISSGGVNPSFGPVGNAPDPAGATVVGSVITLQPASSVLPGVLTAGVQNIGGSKNFIDTPMFDTNQVGFGTNLLSSSLAPGDGVSRFLPVSESPMEITGLPSPGSILTGLDATHVSWEPFPLALSTIGSTPNSSGATLVGSNLQLQPANETFGGVLTNGVQNIGGNKRFIDTPMFDTNQVGFGTNLLTCSLEPADTVTGFLPVAEYPMQITGAPTFESILTGFDGLHAVWAPFPLTLSTIGSTPNSSGASLVGSALQLQPAGATFGGVVSTSAQSFGGNKTFTNNISVNGSVNFTSVSGSPGGTPQAVIINPTTGLLGSQTAATITKVTANNILSLNTGSITTMTVRGVTTTSVPVTKMRVGDLVTVTIPAFSITAVTGSPVSILFGALGAVYSPTYRLMLPIVMFNANSTYVSGFLDIASDGSMSMAMNSYTALGVTFGILRDVTVCFTIV